MTQRCVHTVNMATIHVDIPKGSLKEEVNMNHAISADNSGNTILVDHLGTSYMSQGKHNNIYSIANIRSFKDIILTI